MNLQFHGMKGYKITGVKLCTEVDHKYAHRVWNIVYNSAVTYMATMRNLKLSLTHSEYAVAEPVNCAQKWFITSYCDN
jgi:hypothetical protein